MSTIIKDPNTELEDRTGFFKKIGPEIARQMTQALQKLTAESVNVGFSDVQTFEQNAVSVDVGEKCFGSYLGFTCAADTPIFDGDNLEGIVLAVFPTSSAKTLTELLLKRYLHKDNRDNIDHNLKLSAFKEAVNILVMTYIAEVANTLKVKLRTDLLKFACFRNIELSKPALLRKNLSQDSLVSVGQFNISACSASTYGGGDPGNHPLHLLKGALLWYISLTE